MKVAITGETGFLGYHLTQYLKYHLNYEVVSLSRDYQNNINLVKTCDWLIHCSGVNRGSDVGRANILLATELVNLLKKNDIKINIAFASSIQEFNKTEYGLSKIKCNEILHEYCTNSNSKFISYKLPNLFGPFGIPNYNSVVATFCYNIVNNIKSEISDNITNLCYVYDAIEVISSFKDLNSFNLKEISINDLFNRLLDFHTKYTNGIIPELLTKFDIQLFNTYRSFAVNVHKFTRSVDERGYLVELLKCYGAQSQIFFSTTKPGVTRGNHFHFNKIERFCILKGSAKIELRKLGTDKIISYIIDESMNTVIDMPVLYTHNITNIGSEELVCAFWVNEIFDANYPDTYFNKV
jgi:UDP-2-acetamido-2,6-beta-L-arabino-hexul-4-ose reductase